jgi:hypothetical protein
MSFDILDRLNWLNILGDVMLAGAGLCGAVPLVLVGWFLWRKASHR